MAIPKFTDPNQGSLLDIANRDRANANKPRWDQIFAGPPEPPPSTPEERRDDGMARAERHADREEPDWSLRAKIYLTVQVRNLWTPFLAEDLVAKAEAEGIPSPPDKRAWGAVFRRLAFEKVIRKVGYAPAKSSNLSPKVLWETVRPFVE